MLSSFGVLRLAAFDASAFHSPPRRHDAEPVQLGFDGVTPYLQITLTDHINHAAVSRSLAKSHLTNMKPRPRNPSFQRYSKVFKDKFKPS